MVEGEKEREEIVQRKEIMRTCMVFLGIRFKPKRDLCLLDVELSFPLRMQPLFSVS